MAGEATAIVPYSPPIDLEPSRALSLIAKALPSLKGRKIGVLVTNGADSDRLKTLRTGLEKEGADLVVVAPKIGGVTGAADKHLPADMSLPGAPSVFFDAVAILASAEGIKPLLKNAAAIDWVRDAFGHLKVIGHTAAAQALFAKAGIEQDLDEGVIEFGFAGDIKRFVEAAMKQRVWYREARLSSLEE
jgi:catalase